MRRRKYSPCWPAARAGGGGAGARRPARGCAGLPAPGGHAPGGAGSPGTRRNLPGILRSWGGRGLVAAAPGSLSSSSPDSPHPFGPWGKGDPVPPPGRPGPPPPALAPAEPRNFPGAGAKVSAKWCPSCWDGASEPARGARRGTRAPPGRRPGAPGRGGGSRDPSPASCSLSQVLLDWTCLEGAPSLSRPQGWEKWVRAGLPSGLPLYPPLVQSFTVIFAGGGGRDPWDPSPASSVSRHRVCTEGAGRGPLLELAPRCVRVCVRPPCGPHLFTILHSLQK